MCELHDEADAGELPPPDCLHPDATTHRLVGEPFARLARGPGGVLGTAYGAAAVGR